jgi:tetratricopeptide (TPR) repeat protein
MPLIESAGRRYLRLGRTDMQASIELSLSNCAVSSGKLDDALKHAQQAKNISSETKNEAGVAYSNIQIGEILLRMNEGKRAFESFSEAEKCVNSSNAWHSMAWRAKWGIARAEYMLENYEKAFDAISSSIEYISRLGNDAEDRPSKSEWMDIFKFAIDVSHRLGKKDAAERFAELGGNEVKEYISTKVWKN